MTLADQPQIEGRQNEVYYYYYFLKTELLGKSHNSVNLDAIGALKEKWPCLQAN